MNVVNLCWRLAFLLNDYKTLTKESVVCYIGTKHPEAGPWHMFTVAIVYQRNDQIRVIKLIRGSKVLNFKFLWHGDILFFAPEPKIGS